MKLGGMRIHGAGAKPTLLAWLATIELLRAVPALDLDLAGAFNLGK